MSADGMMAPRALVEKNSGTSARLPTESGAAQGEKNLSGSFPGHPITA